MGTSSGRSDVDDPVCAAGDYYSATRSALEGVQHTPVAVSPNRGLLYSGDNSSSKPLDHRSAGSSCDSNYLCCLRMRILCGHVDRSFSQVLHRSEQVWMPYDAQVAFMLRTH